MLKGERALPLDVLAEILISIHRIKGPEPVVRVLDHFLAPLNLHAVDRDGVPPQPKSIDDEIDDVARAQARLIATADAAGVDGVLDPSEARAIINRGDALKVEISELQGAVRSQAGKGRLRDERRRSS